MEGEGKEVFVVDVGVLCLVGFDFVFFGDVVVVVDGGVVVEVGVGLFVVEVGFERVGGDMGGLVGGWGDGVVGRFVLVVELGEGGGEGVDGEGECVGGGSGGCCCVEVGFCWEEGWYCDVVCCL